MANHEVDGTDHKHQIDNFSNRSSTDFGCHVTQSIF